MRFIGQVPCSADWIDDIDEQVTNFVPLREQKSVSGVILSHFAVLWSASGVILREKIFDLPALQVEQVKNGVFGGIYEDNAWKSKLNSNRK